MKNNSEIAIPGLHKESIIVILSSAGVLMTWSVGSSYLEAGPISASIITYALYIFYWFYAWKFRNPLVKRMVIIGTVAGVLELVTDHYLVETIDSLVYPQSELMIWSSPAYMPFAWSNVLMQLSFVGVLLVRRYGLIKASIGLGIAGGLYIPVYEHLAKDAGWWYYNLNVTMFMNAPLYVILCEALISLSLPLIVLYADHHRLQRSLSVGVVLGIWIYVSAILSYIIGH